MLKWIFCLMFAFVPLTAMALPKNEMTVLFLDQNGSVIGSQLTYCNGVLHQAGIIDHHYYIYLSKGCGDVVCTGTTHGNDCSERNYERDVGGTLPGNDNDWDAACLKYFREGCYKAPIFWYGQRYGFIEPGY